MPVPEPSFTLGIEEEYLLVDRQTGDLAEAPDALMAACEARLKDRVSPEFLQSQIEVGTGVCGSLDAARDELADLRACVGELAAEHGLAPMAASTHPFASWRGQHHTDKGRYNVLAAQMQMAARRLLVSGMHVHVAVEDDDLRIDLMNQLVYFLPHLLALSTSSPFWEGEETGMKSYRLSVFDGLPRSGLPESFESHGAFRRTVDVMLSAGLIDDPTKLWWDVRPSARFPTLELRITDVCTRIDDALAIAGLFRCLCRMLYRYRRGNTRWRNYPRMLIEENRWRAQRFGFDEGLVDFGKSEIVPFSALSAELCSMLAEDADAFGCAWALERAHAIVSEGTSAHRQLSTFHAAQASGMDRDAALRQVVQALITETAMPPS